MTPLSTPRQSLGASSGGAFAPNPARLPALRMLVALTPPSAVLVSAFPLLRPSAADVAGWFADDAVATLAPARELLRPLLAELSTPCPVLGRLPTSVPLHVVRREREGGRRYAFHRPGYAGPRVVSERQFHALPPAPSLLLPSIPRRLRSAFVAPRGRRYVVADVDRCFPTLLATVAGDDALLEAARLDVHQEAGDAMAPRLPADQRRRLGKRFNNAVIGLVSPEGWHRTLRELGLDATADDARRMHDAWWARFEAARHLRDTWVRLHRHAAERGLPLRLTYPDGRRLTFDAATVRGVARRPRWVGLRGREQRLQAAIRTTFSAVWRGIEGVLLDDALRRIQPLRCHGLRLVLPTYDGLLLQAPTAMAPELALEVRSAFHDALRQLGVTATATVEVREAWGATNSATGGAAARCVM